MSHTNRRKTARKQMKGPTSRADLLARQREGIRKFLARLGKLRKVHGDEWVKSMKTHYGRKLAELDAQLKARR